MLGRQASDGHQYMKRDQAGRGLQSVREAYIETRVRVSCYVAKLHNMDTSSMAEGDVEREKGSCY